MEPVIATIVMALVAGATAAAKDVATAAIKDGYKGLKKLISDRYAAATPAVEAVDEEPDDEAEQKVLAKRLDRAGAGADTEVRAAAQALLDAVLQLKGQAAAEKAIDFERVRAGRDLKVSDVRAIGGIKLRDTSAGRDMTFTNIDLAADSPTKKK